MKYGELNLGQIEALVNKLGGKDVVLGILRGTVELVVKTISFITCTLTVPVDETLTVEEAVKAGKFDWSNENITSTNFPKPENGTKSEREMALFHFNKDMSSKAVIAKMNKEGWRPATIWDLLGLAKKEPDLQRPLPIVALGSIADVDGDRNVEALFGNDIRRHLYLRRFDDVWPDHCRFLAVRLPAQAGK